MDRPAIKSVGIALAFFVVASAAADGKPTTEKGKIEALIAHVEGMKDAEFVRNGRAYDAKAAAEFLRRKWAANADDIETARDFVEKAASVSSTSGKPYLVRFKDGREVKSGEYLLGELRKLEEREAPHADRPPAA